MKLLRPFLLFALLPWLAAPLFAAGASGKFTADDQSIAPTAATAYEVRDSTHPRQRAVELMLAGAALDPAALAGELDPHAVAINSAAAKGNYVLLWVRTDGSVSMNATFSATMTQYLDNTRGSLKAELSENGPQRVAGRVWTPAPVKTLSGETWSVDVKFAADVLRPPAGTALAADGGAPGRALEALYRAVARKDWAGIRATVAPGKMTAIEHDYNTPEENLKDAVETLGDFWLPRKHKIAGGELRGDVAVLEVEGELFAGATWLFLVQMTKGEAGWQFADKSPVGKLD